MKYQQDTDTGEDGSWSSQVDSLGHFICSWVIPSRIPRPTPARSNPHWISVGVRCPTLVEWFIVAFNRALFTHQTPWNVRDIFSSSDTWIATNQAFNQGWHQPVPLLTDAVIRGAFRRLRRYYFHLLSMVGNDYWWWMMTNELQRLIFMNHHWLEVHDNEWRFMIINDDW